MSWKRNTNANQYEPKGQNLPDNDPRKRLWLTKRRLVKAHRANDPERIVTLSILFQQLKKRVAKLCACGCGQRVSIPGGMTQVCRLRQRYAQQQ